MGERFQAQREQIAADGRRLTVVCTGRGEHKRRVLVELGVWLPNGTILVSPVATVFYPSRICVAVPRTGENNPAALNAAETWESRCPSCSRTPRIRKTHLVAAARAGKAEF